MKPLFAIALLLLPLPGAAETDPLFQRMLGHWKGTGTRTYPISGRRVQVIEDVLTVPESVGGESAILSRDQVTETGPGGQPAPYVTQYWIRAKTGVSGRYELGIQGPQGPGPASSTGILGSDGVFRVEQDLGGGYVVRSETRFEPDRTIYSEIFSSGSGVQSRTEIDYMRCVSDRNR